MAQSAVCNNKPSPYNTVGFTGHIAGLRDQIGVTFGCATQRLLRPGGPASTPEWTGPSAVRPKWSTPASNSEERPAWLGDDLQCYTVPSVTNSCNLPEIEIRGQGQSQGRSQGRSGRLDIYGKQYEFPCRPEWKHFERPRHVTDTVETCLVRPLSNDQKTVTLEPPPCDYSAAKDQNVCSPSQSSATKCNFDPPLVTMSPYDLPNNHPDKYIPQGYTGVIPYKRLADAGETYGDTTRQSMNRVTCDRMNHQRRLASDDDTTCRRNVGQRFLTVDCDGKTRPMTTEDCCRRRPEQQTIYRRDKGMIPNYTGHLPGYRWRIGHTFGLATRNLKRELRHPRHIPPWCR